MEFYIGNFIRGLEKEFSIGFLKGIHINVVFDIITRNLDLYVLNIENIQPPKLVSEWFYLNNSASYGYFTVIFNFWYFIWFLMTNFMVLVGATHPSRISDGSKTLHWIRPWIIFRNQEDAPPAPTYRNGARSKAISWTQAGAEACQCKWCVRL